MTMSDGVLGVVLAGGEGRRMWPFATVRPKASLPVANRALVRLLAERLRLAGVSRLVVVVDARGGPVRAALLDLDGVRVLEAQVRGSAQALLAAWSEAHDSPALVVPGDVLVSVGDLEQMRRAAEALDGEASVLVAPMGGEDPNRCLCVRTEGDALVEVIGHPREASERWTGVCVLSPAFRRYLEANPGLLENVPVGGMPALEPDLAASMALGLQHGATVRAIRSEGAFVDLDKPWHILQANHYEAEQLFSELKSHRVASSAWVSEAADIEGRLMVAEGAVVGPRVRIRGDVSVGAGAVVDNGAILQGQVIVGAGARVRDYCQLSDAVVGPNCVVGHGAEFSGVMFAGTYLYHYCEVVGVLGASVDIGAATVCGTLRFDDAEKLHQVGGAWERPPVGANASYIGDYSRTGVNAILMPGVKVGAYSCVGPGVVLYEDVPDRTLTLVKQELTVRPWGPEQYGW
ncbi:MAG: NTP transferase domain-containing protein [Anaerolineae bacterium]|nr:NTP transferase domain-containing protein [Anaerolineae bacterium]